MLDFSRINKNDNIYSTMLHYITFAHNKIYYKEFTVVGRNHIPENEGLLIIGNHQNGLNDALGILMAMKGHTTCFIARGDLFKKDFLGKLLRFLRIMPAFRKRDGGETLGENEEIFKQSARIISEGDCVTLFPEAQHQHGHYLGSFKKGFARIAFSAAEATGFKKKIYILPIGNHYDNYFHIRGKLLMNIGEPFAFDDLYDIYQEHPERARYLLTQRAREKVRELMLDISDHDHYEQYDLLRNIYRKKYMSDRSNKRTMYNDLKADQAIVAEIEKFAIAEPEKFESLMADTSEYETGLKKLGVRDWIIGKKDSFGGFWLRLLLWILFLPIWFACAAINILPYNAGWIMTRKIRDKMLHPSVNLGLGMLVTFPLWYLIISIASGMIFNSFWAGLLTMVLLPLTLLIYYDAKVLFIKLYNRVKRTFYILSKNKSFADLKKLRYSLIDRLDKLFNCNLAK